MARTSEIAKLRAELEEMGRRLVSLTEESMDEMSDETAGYIDRTRKIAADKFDRAKELTEAGRAKVQDYTDEHPWHMVAAGAAIGFLIGYITRKRD